MLSVRDVLRSACHAPRARAQRSGDRNRVRTEAKENRRVGVACSDQADDLPSQESCVPTGDKSAYVRHAPHAESGRHAERDLHGAGLGASRGA